MRSRDTAFTLEKLIESGEFDASARGYVEYLRGALQAAAHNKAAFDGAPAG
jgi:hypothetical protein